MLLCAKQKKNEIVEGKNYFLFHAMMQKYMKNTLLIFHVSPLFIIPDHVREFTCGKLFYRTFHLDEDKDALYVGAM
jgi:hypothetical protein